MNKNEKRVLVVGFVALVAALAVVPAAAYQAFRPAVPVVATQEAAPVPVAAQNTTTTTVLPGTWTPTPSTASRAHTVAKKTAEKPLRCHNENMQMGTYGDTVRICDHS